MKRYNLLAWFFGLLTACHFSYATEQQDGQYVWQFLSGQPWPQGYNRNIGKPDNLIWSRHEYSDDFYQRINNALPESEINEAFITNTCTSDHALSRAIGL